MAEFTINCNKSKHELYDWVVHIFQNVHKKNSAAITKYLCWKVCVIFKNKSLFIYEPFESFRQMNRYYDLLNRHGISGIEQIIIYDDNIIYTNVDNLNIQTLENVAGNLQDYCWEEFCDILGYKDIDFEGD